MFEENAALIREACVRLENEPVEKALHGYLVLGGLKRVAEIASALDARLPGDLPFANHFFSALTSLPHDDEGHWISLLEDLALIFRAKALGAPDLEVSGIERTLLEYFETSGEWKDTGMVVTTLYWYELPQRFKA